MCKLLAGQLIEDQQFGGRRALNPVTGSDDDEVVDDEKDDVLGEAGIVAEKRLGQVGLGGAECELLGGFPLLSFFALLLHVFTLQPLLFDLVVADEVEKRLAVGVDRAAGALLPTTTVRLRTGLGLEVIRTDRNGLLVLVVSHGNSPKL